MAVQKRIADCAKTHSQQCTCAGKFLILVHGHALAAHPTVHLSGFNY